VLVLFVGYCFGEIVCIWDSYVYQKVFFVFLFIKVIIIIILLLLLFTTIEFSLRDTSSYNSKKYENIYIKETIQKHSKFKYTEQIQVHINSSLYVFFMAQEPLLGQGFLTVQD